SKPAPSEGVFPDDFYATKHLPTQIRIAGQWLDVEGIEMDLGIVVNPRKTGACAVPMGNVRRGDLVVTGRTGIRVTPLQRPQERDVFSFMESQVSAERPDGHIIADVAKRMRVWPEGYVTGRSALKVWLTGGPR